MAKAKIKNLTTDDLGYQGVVFLAGKTVEIENDIAERMANSMPDRFRLVKRSTNRKVSEVGTENRAVE